MALLTKREELNEILKHFAEQHGKITQRGDEWYKLMATTIGGSEIAAILGKDSYKTFNDVAKRKVEYALGQVKQVLMPNCWWGTLFEDVITEYVELDLGDKAHGTEACIQIYPGHRTSPDGYIVVGIKKDKKTIWKTNEDPSEIDKLVAVLLEFKCPVSRTPTHLCPSNYRPQVLSGLALSPMADFGLFVDAVFYKCPYNTLGHDPRYDKVYHKKSLTKNELPIAWGVIAVYAEFQPGLEECFEDLGEDPGYEFYETMKNIDSKYYTVRKYTPELVGNRGEKPPTMDQIRADTPADKTLINIIPWKLFHVTYAQVKRKPNYLDDVLPKVDELHSLVQRALESESPIDYIDGEELDDHLDLIGEINITYSPGDFDNEAQYEAYLESQKNKTDMP